ncbi:MAG: MFS transporter [Rhodoferax sp.]|nr:MFS transporter [Rhodoferax sp.]
MKINNVIPDEYLVSKGHSYFVLTLLFLLMVFDFIDRQILAAILPFIKADWGLSDTQLGMLISSVNIAIAVLAMPAAVVVDRWSRTKSIGIMAILWSIATAACGLANNFIQMFLARLLIGIGEAGYVPGGNAMLSTVFPHRMRATVIGIFNSAAMIGSVLGVVLGGFIASHWGWRAAFGVVAAPGILLAILMFFVKDYKTVKVRVQSEDGKSAREMKWHEFFSVAFKSPLLWTIFIGNGAQLFFVSTLGNWMPSYLNRLYSMSVAQAGIRTGLILIVAAVGMAFSGYLVDKAMKRYLGSRLYGPLLYALFTSLSFVAAFMLPTGNFQMSLIFIGAFFMLGVVGPTQSAAQDVVQPGLRATVQGAIGLASNLFGMALGPVITGALSDQFELKSALLIVSFAPLIGAASFYIGASYYKNALDKNEVVN